MTNDGHGTRPARITHPFAGPGRRPPRVYLCEWIAGRNAAALVQQRPLSTPPRTTAIGALAYYVSHADARNYQPSNITHGIMPPLDDPPRDKALKKARIAERALSDLESWKHSFTELVT